MRSKYRYGYSCGHESDSYSKKNLQEKYWSRVKRILLSSSKEVLGCYGYIDVHVHNHTFFAERSSKTQHGSEITLVWMFQPTTLKKNDQG